jgi:23S rRNA (adenine2030-N6)-methyltransferase
MNYRHSYHAGNFCDVYKHNIIIYIIEYLLNKSTAFAIIDTHSGCGLYNLNEISSIKTGEFIDGVQKIWGDKDSQIEIVATYIEILKQYNENNLNIYTGSPVICSKMLRKIDAHYLNELHPEDYLYLKNNMPKNTNIKNIDGYMMLKSILPLTKYKRSLVIIDPPFEDKSEFQNIADIIRYSLTRSGNSIYCIWYPIKDNDDHKIFYNNINNLNLPKEKLLTCEFYRKSKPDKPNELLGCGIMIINPPWQIENKVNILSDYLLNILEFTEGKFCVYLS